MIQVKKLLPSRDVMDSVVENNASRNYALFGQAKEMPAYRLGTKTEKTTLKFDTKNKSGVNKRSLISPLIDTVNLMELQSGDAHVYTAENGKVVRDEKTNPFIVKLIKASSIVSYSSNEEFTEVMSAFAKELLESPNTIVVPMSLPDKSKLQSLMSEELNEYLRKELSSRDIYFVDTDVIAGKSAKDKKKKDLLNAVNRMA